MKNSSQSRFESVCIAAQVLLGKFIELLPPILCSGLDAKITCGSNSQLEDRAVVLTIFIAFGNSMLWVIYTQRMSLLPPLIYLVACVLKSKIMQWMQDLKGPGWGPNSEQKPVGLVGSGETATNQSGCALLKGIHQCPIVCDYGMRVYKTPRDLQTCVLQTLSLPEQLIQRFYGSLYSPWAVCFKLQLYRLLMGSTD